MNLKDGQVEVKFTFSERHFSAKEDVFFSPSFVYNNFYSDIY